MNGEHRLKLFVPNLEKNPNIQQILTIFEITQGRTQSKSTKKLAPMVGHHSDSIQWINENNLEKPTRTQIYLDLCELETNGKISAKLIIDQLLKTQALHYELQVDKSIDNYLYGLKNDLENNLKYNGFHTLNIGFPLLQLTDKESNKRILAPLFLWKVQLKKPSANTPKWQITHNKHLPISLAPALTHLLRDTYKIDLPELCRLIIEGKQVSAISLSKICYELTSALGKKEDIFIENIDYISARSPKKILCAAVIGNFSGRLCFLKEAKKQSNPDKFIKHPFALSILDPWQHQVFQKFYQQSCLQVNASHGVGKSHLLHYLLINALSNGKTSIVIADSSLRIQKIRNELAIHGLDHLLLDISNPDKDFAKIAQAINYKSSAPRESINDARFAYLINRAKRLKDRLDTVFSMQDQIIFDKKNWSETVGIFLRYNRIEKRDLLDNQLPANDFIFHPTEYLSLKEAIDISKELFEKVGSLNHPLDKLHPDIFLEKNKAEAKRLVDEQLEYFYEKFDQLHHRYILKQQEYAWNLKHNIEDFYQNASLAIENIKDQIEDNRIIYGNDFEDSGLIKTGKLKVYGVFSGKHKNILQARGQINEDFRKLRTLFKEKNKDTFNILESIDTKSISKVALHLDELEDQLYQWYDQSADNMQEELQRLNKKSVPDSLDYKEQIGELEYSLDVALETLNNAGLFKQKLEHKMLTIPKRQLYIQEILHLLRSTRVQMDHFDHFYEWQRHWLLLPEIHRKLLVALIKINPKNWKTAFQSWYFFQLLNNSYHFKMPKDDQLLKSYENTIDELKAILPAQIRQLWKQRSANRKSLKKLSAVTLSELLGKHLVSIQQQFPIFILTEPVAAQLFSEKILNFDLAFVFKDELVEKAALGMIKGLKANHCLVFNTTPKQDKDTAGAFCFLNNVHKKMSKALFDFNNQQLFKQQKKLLTETGKTSLSYSVIPSKGQFKNRVNLREAEQIIEHLIQFGKEKSNQLIAVVCSTKEQRDFIINKINLLKNTQSTSGQSIEQLAKQRLGIFHIGENFANHFDHLLFSLGIHSFKQNANDWLTFLNSQRGYKKLQSLISKNYKSIRIFQSLPGGELDFYSNHKVKKSTRLLASWIKYIESLANKDLEKQYAILNKRPYKALKYHELISEVANELISFIRKDRIITEYQNSEICSTLIVLPSDENGRKTIVYIYPSVVNNSNAHLWNLYFDRHLNHLDANTYKIWAANWFENPHLEARKLASAILKTDRK